MGSCSRKVGVAAGLGAEDDGVAGAVAAVAAKGFGEFGASGGGRLDQRERLVATPAAERLA